MVARRADMGTVRIGPEVLVSGGGCCGCCGGLIIGYFCRLVAAGQAHGRVRPRAVGEYGLVAGVEAVGAALGVGRLRRGPRAAGWVRRGRCWRGERARLEQVPARGRGHVVDGRHGDGACRLDSHLALQLRDVGRLARHVARIDGQGGAGGGLGGRGAVLVPPDGAERGEGRPRDLDTALVDVRGEHGGDGGVLEDEPIARCDHEREGVGTGGSRRPCGPLRPGGPLCARRPGRAHHPYAVGRGGRGVAVGDDRLSPQILARAHGRDGGRPRAGGRGRARR